MSTRSAAASRRKEAETAAHSLLADKVAAVTSLAELGAEVDAAADRVTSAQQAHSAAQQRYAEQYRVARAAGWSVSDLASAGCDQDRAGVALRSRARPRGRPASSSPSADRSSPPLPPTSAVASDAGESTEGPRPEHPRGDRHQPDSVG